MAHSSGDAALPPDHDLSNPKDKIGRLKPGISYIPPVALLEEGRVMADGAAKYGAYNWLDTPIRASIYYDAAMRHLMQWFCGDDIDVDSRSLVLNLASVRACCGILIDAFATGKIIDDRPKKTASATALIHKLTKPKE